MGASERYFSLSAVSQISKTQSPDFVETLFLYFNNGANYKSPKKSWIEFDFGEKQINLTSYTIR